MIVLAHSSAAVGSRGVVREAPTSRAHCIACTMAPPPVAASSLSALKLVLLGFLRVVGWVGHVTEMLVAFNERYPGIEVSVSIGNSRDTVRSLMEFRTDIAVLAYVDKKLPAWHYSKDKIAAFAHKDHPLAKGRRSIRARDLSGQLMVMRERGSNTRRAIEEMHRRPWSSRKS